MGDVTDNESTCKYENSNDYNKYLADNLIKIELKEYFNEYHDNFDKDINIDLWIISWKYANIKINLLLNKIN